MDPNAAYQQWRTASNCSEKIESAEALLECLNKSGFRPRWTPVEEENFYMWCQEKGLA